MAFYFIQRVVPGTELDFGIYLIYKQRCTYSCSSGSQQTSLTRNTNIALARTPKSAMPFRNHKSTLPDPPQSWKVFLDPRLFRSQTPCPAAPSAVTPPALVGFDLRCSAVSVHGGAHPVGSHRARRVGSTQAWGCLGAFITVGLHALQAAQHLPQSFICAGKQHASASFAAWFKTLGRAHAKCKCWGYVQGCLALQRDLPLPSLQGCPAEEKANTRLGHNFRGSFLAHLEQPTEEGVKTWVRK